MRVKKSAVAGTLAETLLKEQKLNLQKLPIDSISKRQLQEGYSVLQVTQIGIKFWVTGVCVTMLSCDSS